jgi:hypothetical protein
MADKGEGKDSAQRVAICNSRAGTLTSEERRALAALWLEAKKKKKKPKKVEYNEDGDAEASKVYPTTWNQGHRHKVPEEAFLGLTKEGTTSYDNGHDHKYTVTDFGHVIIEPAADGHDHYTFEG